MKVHLELEPADIKRAIDAGLRAVKRQHGASIYEIANEDIISRDHIHALVLGALKAVCK